MKLKIILVLLFALTAFFQPGCKKEEPKKEDNTPKAYDLNLLHGGKSKKWYWKEEDGYQDVPLFSSTWNNDTSYLRFDADGKFVYGIKNPLTNVIWQYRFNTQDTFRLQDNSIGGTRKAVTHWLGLPQVSGPANNRFYEYSTRRYRITELTANRLVIQNILQEETPTTRILFVTKP